MLQGCVEKINIIVLKELMAGNIYPFQGKYMRL